MDEAFWQTRWEREQIGFHQADVTLYLAQHWPMLELAGSGMVLVPLCGKSVDMSWLAAQGHQVLGVELSEKAVKAYFEESGLQPQVTEWGGFTCFSAAGVSIYCGDFFALSAEAVAHCVGFFDRAALIALPEPMRERYAAHLQAILPASCRGLLVTLEYEQRQMSGPPFAVAEAEVRERFAGWQIALLQREDVLVGNWKFVRHGLSALHESVYILGRAVDQA